MVSLYYVKEKYFLMPYLFFDKRFAIKNVDITAMTRGNTVFREWKGDD